MQDKTQIIDYLNQDPLRYMVHLKVLRNFAEHVQAFRDGDVVLVLMLAEVTPWDMETYPNAKWVVMPVNGLIVDKVPTDGSLLFKFTDELSKAAALERYSLEWQRSFTSYTTPAGTPYPLPDEVTVSDKLDPLVLEIFQRNGHDRDGVTQLFEQGQAASFTIYESDYPISVCYVFPNTDSIWEIAGLHTQADKRGQGYGRKVVYAALHWLINKGYTPRYHVQDNNAPSIALAKAVGLRECLHIEHYLGQEPT
jgi:RimJ/RimL family protein N-acetyltransferase